MTIIDKACYERGCACHDPRIDGEGVEVELTQPVQEPVAWADMDVRGEDKGLSWTPGHFHKTPLYTTLQPSTAACATDELRRLHEEVQEQCRINGMGAERELALLARIDRLEQQLGEAVWNYSEKVRVSQELLEALKGAANYIDTMGGISSSYRQLIAKAGGNKWPTEN